MVSVNNQNKNCMITKIIRSHFHFQEGTPYRDSSGIRVPGIISFRSHGEHYVRCVFCIKFPSIVKQYITGKPPGITSEEGTRYYGKIFTAHLQSQYHKECAKHYRFSLVEVDEAPSMEIAISKANKKQIDRVGKLMIGVYLDAKRLNLSAFSWPSRYVAFWCAAHRAELAWKNTGEAVAEVGKTLSELSSISTYFHFSALRSAELKTIACDNELKLLNIPKIFDIRWSQFTFKLVRSVVVSWKALIIYFQKHQDEASCVGYLNYLTKLDNLKLFASLADVLFAYHRFQKKLQPDRPTLIEMRSHITNIVKALDSIEAAQLAGGFESRLAIKLKTGLNGEICFKSVKLQLEGTSRTRQRNRAFVIVRKNVLDTLRKFLAERFQIDEPLLRKIEPFINLNKEFSSKKYRKIPT